MFQLEREFVKTVKAGLQELGSGNALQADDAVRVVETVIASAKTVKARAVMIAARRCLVPAKENRLSTAFELRTLSRLAGQYADGLLEVDTQTDGQNTPSEDTATALYEDSQAPADAKEVAELAAGTLENVLPFAPARDAAALQALLRLGRADARDGSDEIKTDKPVFLESLIAPVTSQALVSAHRAHKQVSLSYACEHIAVQSDVAPALQSLMLTLCDSLIEHSLQHPASREAAGLSATGQIALTATQTRRGLTLDVFCDDRAVTQDDLLSGPCARALSDYRVLGGDIDFQPGRPSGVMLALTHSAGPKPVYNAPVLREAIA